MKSKILKISLFCIIFALLFSAVQGVLTPDHNENQNVHYQLDSYSNFDEDTMEVLFLGQSSALLGISPMKLYEDTNICSYDLATGGQPLGVSYQLLKYALKKQSPSVVFLTSGNLFADNTAQPTWRYLLDNTPLGIEKLEMAKAYGGLAGSDGFLSVIFPIIKFHTRWESLGKNDFIQNKDLEYYYSAGQFVVGLKSPIGLTLDQMNSIAETMEQLNEAPVAYMHNGTEGSYMIDDPLYKLSIPEDNIEYMRKIQSLCQENGAQLVLLTIPNRSFPMMSQAAWTKQMSAMTKEMADQLEIPYLDLEYDVDTGVDFATDTYDGGTHLNLFGAEKVTACLEEYLKENYSLSANKNAVWDEMLSEYQYIRELAGFQAETDLSAYISYLAEHENEWAILITASEDYASGMTEEKYAIFDQLGLKMLRNGGFADSYLAVVQDGEVEYEALSKRRIDYETVLGADKDIPASLVSAGWYNGSEAKIIVDGMGLSAGRPGLNIAVLDQKTGLVMDSASINTRDLQTVVTHNAMYYGYLPEYAYALNVKQ